MAYGIDIKGDTLVVTTTKGDSILTDADLKDKIILSKWTVPTTQGIPYGKYDKKSITLRKYVYYLKTGVWVNRDCGKCLTHKDGNPLNCKFENLMLVDKGVVLRKPRMKVQNRSKSGYPGVTWNKQNNRWFVYAYFNGKQKYLGSSTDLDEAIKMRKDYLGVE